MSAIPSQSDAMEPATERDLAVRGFRPFTTTASKGHAFAIWLKPPGTAGRTAWKAAVLSRGTLSYATAYVAADGVLRASVPIPDPVGYLLFRTDTRRGEPVAGVAFQCKFGTT